MRRALLLSLLWLVPGIASATKEGGSPLGSGTSAAVFDTSGKRKVVIFKPGQSPIGLAKIARKIQRFTALLRRGEKGGGTKELSGLLREASPEQVGPGKAGIKTIHVPIEDHSKPSPEQVRLLTEHLDLHVPNVLIDRPLMLIDHSSTIPLQMQRPVVNQLKPWLAQEEKKQEKLRSVAAELEKLYPVTNRSGTYQLSEQERLKIMGYLVGNDDLHGVNPTVLKIKSADGK
jgi:hypothetical protein